MGMVREGASLCWWWRRAEEAEAASEALVCSKPSGYWRIGLPGSPGRSKGGWAGLSVRLPVPQLPTQNEAT